MEIQRCPFCGGGDLVYDRVRGETTCGNPSCGEIIEESAMQVETSFVQRNGRSVASSSQVKWSGLGNVGSTNRSSYEMTLQRGLYKMTYIAERLRLEASAQEAGRRMYALAVQMDFNTGRSTRFVAAACLYLVCRRMRLPLLLIDFADVLHQPVRKLGQVYVRLMQRLVGGDPARGSAVLTGQVGFVDPSIFVERFSRDLELGQNLRRVQGTASKLIQLMHRDWICLGRRPQGLCGAALFVAAAYHGQQLSSKRVADLVRMSEITIRTRMQEMQSMPMALMDRAAFDKATPNSLAIEEGHQKALPPCLRQRREKERIALMDLEGPQNLAALADDLVANKRRKKLLLPIGESKSYDEPAASSSAGDVVAWNVEDGSVAAIEAIAQDIVKSKLKGGAAATEGGLVLDAAASQSLDELMDAGPDDAKERAAVSACASAEASAEASEDEKADTLSDVDNAELEALLLDEEEVQNKSDIWHEVNKDYLEEWHHRDVERRRRREEKSASAAETSSAGGSSSRRGRQRYPKASSPADSVSMALKSKSKVKAARINMDALEELFK